MEASEAQDILNQTVTESKFRPAVLKQAAVGLGLLGDKSAVGLLLTMLEDAKGLSSQAAIASALGTIGDVSAVDGLVKMLAGETEKKMTDTARGFAAVALGITCDKEDFPLEHQDRGQRELPGEHPDPDRRRDRQRHPGRADRPRGVRQE